MFECLNLCTQSYNFQHNPNFVHIKLCIRGTKVFSGRVSDNVWWSPTLSAVSRKHCQLLCTLHTWLHFSSVSWFMNNPQRKDTMSDAIFDSPCKLLLIFPVLFCSQPLKPPRCPFIRGSYFAGVTCICKCQLQQTPCCTGRLRKHCKNKRKEKVESKSYTMLHLCHVLVLSSVALLASNSAVSFKVQEFIW